MTFSSWDLSYWLVEYDLHSIKLCSIYNRLLDTLVVDCWLRVWEVLGSIRSQGPRHNKDVNVCIPVVPLFSTQH